MLASSVSNGQIRRTPGITQLRFVQELLKEVISAAQQSFDLCLKSHMEQRPSYSANSDFRNLLEVKLLPSPNSPDYRLVT